MMLIKPSTFLEFFYGIPEFFALHRITFEISLNIVGHALCKLCNSTCTDAIHVYESFMVELIDQRKSIPEKVSYLELKFVMIFVREALSYLLNLIL